MGSAGIATATLAVSGSQLSIGSVTITATYTRFHQRDGLRHLEYYARRRCRRDACRLRAFQNSASFASEAYAPGMVITVYGSHLAPSAIGHASSVPFPVTMDGVAATVNGEAAPLYYVSPGQFNIQIPYETAIGTATLEIDNNGQVSVANLLCGRGRAGYIYAEWFSCNRLSRRREPQPAGRSRHFI